MLDDPFEINDAAELFNVETIVATLAHIAAGAGDRAAVAALAASRPQLMETGYDNWNGGTHELTLYLTVSPQVYGQLFRVREDLERNLLKMLQPIIEAEGGCRASAVTFVPADTIPADWREECLNALHGGSIHNQGLPFGEDKPLHLWKSLRFRSQTEIRIAEAVIRNNSSSVLETPSLSHAGKSHDHLGINSFPALTWAITRGTQHGLSAWRVP